MIKATLLLLSLVINSILMSSIAFAADNQEMRLGGIPGTLYDRKWSTVEFPVNYSIEQNGVVNNDVNGNGTAALTEAQVRPAVQAAFSAWQNVPTANITYNYAGTTATTLAGCDRLNLVTWSDNVANGNTVARGITSYYNGPAMILDDVNRLTINCNTGGTALLPLALYPNGMTLQPGTILDADLAYAASNFDYVLVPNATASVGDVQGYSTHETGHMGGLTHTSIGPASSTLQASMFPALSTSNPNSQNGVRALHTDDSIGISMSYPGSGFFPGGSGAATTGAIRGTVLEADGTAAQGIRVWAYNVNDTNNGYVEVYTKTDHDFENATHPAGSYVIPGLPPGKYHVCIVPWNNDFPDIYVFDESDPSSNRYARTATDFSVDGFATECYDDALSPSPGPLLNDKVREVDVSAGNYADKINFILGMQTSDIVLVMDRSGSMSLNSGTLGVNKLQALQSAASFFVDYLLVDGSNQLGLVQFEENLVAFAPAYNLQELTAGSATAARTAIDSMDTGGWTNIIAGITEGVAQLGLGFNPNKIMVVFSDGKHNRPIGSDLNDVHDPVVDNDIKFYSVGFGTDIDDAILSDIAADSGGTHVNEQDLNANELKYHFLRIAASATDDVFLVDPRFQLGAGEKEEINTLVSEDETQLKFLTLWSKPDTKRVAATITTPGGCQIQNTSPGVEVKNGKTYSIIKVSLPYTCRKQAVRAGRWMLTGKRDNVGSEKEEVDLLILATSGVKIFAETAQGPAGTYLGAKLVRHGEVVKNAQFSVELTTPRKSTKDSELQDAYPEKFAKHPDRIYTLKTKPAKKDSYHLSARQSPIDGLGLRKKSRRVSWQGARGVLIPAKQRGTYKAYIKASYKMNGKTYHKELTTSFTVK